MTLTFAHQTATAPRVLSQRLLLRLVDPRAQPDDQAGRTIALVPTSEIIATGSWWLPDKDDKPAERDASYRCCWARP